ncbi:MAG: prepilin-type N-terminal cleavage/methylation domain-containing protein [candidate division NC10 bacterium]|nr:prepilin-type N-terminal cleavage/methylation domain-containing protein [candidate division NC10 bacterium]
MSHGTSDWAFRQRSGGFTLIETLIAAALFSVVITGVYVLYTTMQSTLSRGALKTDLQQNARVGLDRMVQEIRMAGYDPSGAIPLVTLLPKAAIRAASSTCLSFVSYNPSPPEKSAQITYDLNETTLRRKEEPWVVASLAFSGGNGAQPQAESVNALTFTYYDANNAVLTPVSWTSKHRCPPKADQPEQAIVQLDYYQMDQIRRVAITLRTSDSRSAISTEYFTLTSDVRLRNK